MMDSCRLLILILLLFSFPLKGHEQDLLQLSNVNEIMEQIFSKHLESQTITTKIIQSSVDNYLDQFDPNGLYLLEEEVSPYLALNPAQINQIIDQYKKRDFIVFNKLNQLIQRGIMRARELRQEIENHSQTLFDTPIPPSTDNERGFAENISQLKQRWLRNLQEEFESRKKRVGNQLTAAKQLELVKAYEEKLRDAENKYLYVNEKGEPLSQKEQENLFSIHILKALAGSLDSHTTFYMPNEAYDMRVRLQKEFKGIGILVQETNNGPMVKHILKGGSAEESGKIKEGDIIVKVDGKSVAGLSFDEVMGLIHGEKNGKISLTVKRKGESGGADQEYTAELPLKEIIIDNGRVDVSSQPFGNGIIGIITLHAFYQGKDISSEKDVREALDQLQSQGDLRGLILDLRNNSGGFLSQAVKVAGLFITDGVIVISKYSNGDEKIYRDVDGKTAYDGPLIILTSKATASAAEIVAQALQDYGVALVVGDEHTYGKGTIQTQTVTDNQSSSYFKVTVGKYYTVSGHTPQKEGVKADVIVPGHWNKEDIGESGSDAIDNDIIPPAYDDTLSDLPPDIKRWYMKYYIPHLQKPVTAWRNFLPALRKNSENRIARNKNYQFFLNGPQAHVDGTTDEDEDWEATKKNKTSGVDDLQLQEAVNVLKDMVYLGSVNKVGVENPIDTETKKVKSND
jgi:carboxyl-terminal processing protease